MQESADTIVERIQTTFNNLPQKAKPRVYPDGSREWTPLSGIVLSIEKDGLIYSECAALGTGMRCLPASKIAFAKGCCLHDWHAEIVAIRAFNLFLLHECSRLAADPTATSLYIRRRREEEKSEELFQPFEVDHNVKIHMYSSEAPCGDASMELTMKAQDDATPWAVESDNDQTSATLSGRGNFSNLGVVRRKPARADAPPTLSKSCSDKLALKQCTSMLSCLAYLMITPNNAYLHQLILPNNQVVHGAVERAFGPAGRMSPLKLTERGLKSWAGGFRYSPFLVTTTTKPFAYSRSPLPIKSRLTGSNVTAMWTPMRQEVLIGGTIQGYKQFAHRGATAISRLGTWKLILSIVTALNDEVLIRNVQAASYEQLKASPLLSFRRAVKADVTSSALPNWVPNNADNFSI